ncbi:MAG: J domain-containing protein [bacterium]|nr:J domain-containing protein [bacterium]
MFNRPTSATSKTEKTFIPVVVTLVDGESLKGAIAIPKNSRLGDLLNGSDRYVLFKTNTGEPIYLSQTSIAAVQSNEKPSACQLDVSLKNLEEINPYLILKVKPGTNKADLRNAYHKLVKNYHPDQFANIKLPPEVKSYLDAVITRLNAAFQELIDEIDRLERVKLAEATARKGQNTDTIRYFGQ